MTEELLNCVNKDVLVTLSHKTGLKIKKNGVNSDYIVKAIIDQIGRQKTIFGVKLSNNPSFLKKCHSIIGQFISITDLTQDVLNKCQLLFYLDPHKTIQDTVLAHIGKRKYPKYKIFNDECKADTVIFPTKQIFLDYTNSLQFESEYEELWSQFDKKKDDVSELIAMITQCAQS